MSDCHFEDFLPSGGTRDLFEKLHRLDQFLKEGEHPGASGLGVLNLSGANPSCRLQGRDGEIRPVLMLGSNSYLNLTTHPKVVAAAHQALDRYGYGAGAVSLYAGITELHRELEMAIARFYRTEAALLFPSGYGANVGVISALCGPGDVVINDAANHASILDGALLSRADIKLYPHNSMEGLERILRRLPESQAGRLIVTDGVFSMHGDLAPLDRIVALARRYGARVMVDDAHGIGIVGPSGRGTAEAFGVMPGIDIHVAMLSKAPGGLGGFAAGSTELIQYLKLYARTYFFSTALPASVCAGLLEVFKLFESDQAGRLDLLARVADLKARLSAAGFRIGDSASGIVPLLVGDEELLYAFQRRLFESGVYANTVTYPAVRRRECRIRFCVMATLTPQELERAAEIIISTGRELGLIGSAPR
jgi:glycine C-acetyltransferase